MLVSVKMQDYQIFELLKDRLEKWAEGKVLNNVRISEEEKELFLQMYDYLSENYPEGMELDIKNIVDNDIVNYCKIIKKGEVSEKAFNRLKELYKEGERDLDYKEDEALKGEIFCSYIESFNGKDMFLLRA